MCKEVRYEFKCGHRGGPQIFVCDRTRGLCKVKREARFICELCHICRMAGDVAVTCR